MPILPGTIVDATIFAAPSFTTNEKRERDPEMHQTCKGKQWHVGMKVHIGVDSESGRIQPGSEIPGLAWILFMGQLDARLNLAEGHGRQVQMGVLDALKPSQNSAMGLGRAAACRRRHSSTGTSTAVSLPRRDTT